ncbi:phosphoglycerate mutase (2,3-diphosphoglycerate-independent) [candidate division CPR3 bacterium 4484_211]|uniref:2,3-bisphosphoglycerate-independent phosphoglycerate mutase n=1 Tax=candidate division CPR3 bacterium 4484_211 TaxID=1968527 RepID=A0A1W9NZ52_UNCC3|nr:MAG: phosphoglycerate mutase (2,3-diphosphoglycerate-independent) [candidate division CPR3 bacterium 4484_211]
MTTYKFAVLIILDGWGIAPPSPGNAVASAKTPTFDYLTAHYPHSQLQASGKAVGLPETEFGNSETGHLNIGAGYIVPQDVAVIDRSIEDGSFFKKEALINVCRHVKKHHSALHIMGLLGNRLVHSSTNHLFALLRAAKEQNVDRVCLHLFTDGRDTPPQSAQEFINEVNDFLKNRVQLGQISSIIGRFYAMDRDKRWNRTQQAYDLLTLGKGYLAETPAKAILDAYRRGETDEFISPTKIGGGNFVPIQNKDGVIFFNFRFDRPRQLTSAFVEPDFAGFKRNIVLKDLFFITMTPYEKNLPVSGTLFKHIYVEHPLAEIISEQGLTQLHLAESEKFPHVTYFFNGGHEAPFPGEQTIKVPSPRVATYDQKPEMSAPVVTEILLERIKADLYNFILVNYANADMVGHTGNLKAARKAVSAVDDCLGKVIPEILRSNGFCLIIADHGNAEVMIDPQTGKIDTAHNNSPVPCIAVAQELKDNKNIKLRNGILADVAPTILEVLGIAKPEEMTGRSLIAG